MAGSGWIKLHRELLDKPIWLCSRIDQRIILITILLLANHKEKDWIFKGKRYVCQPGQLITSLPSLSETSGTSIQAVRTALKNFEEIHRFLTDESTNRNRLITVLNWELYQSRENESTDKTTSNQQAINRQLTANKNDKNLKNLRTKEKEDLVSLDLNSKEEISKHILFNYDKYLKDDNINRKQQILTYLDEGLDVDVIIEAIRDSATADIPCIYVFAVLNNCRSQNINNLQLYLDQKKAKQQAEKIRQATEKNRIKSYNNFEQREYTDEELEKYYVNFSDKIQKKEDEIKC